MGRLLDYKKWIGGKVTVLRTSRGMSRDDLANATGLKLQYITELENGLKSPSFIVRKKLAKALKIKEKELDIAA